MRRSRYAWLVVLAAVYMLYTAFSGSGRIVVDGQVSSSSRREEVVRIVTNADEVVTLVPHPSTASRATSSVDKAVPSRKPRQPPIIDRSLPEVVPQQVDAAASTIDYTRYKCLTEISKRLDSQQRSSSFRSDVMFNRDTCVGRLTLRRESHLCAKALKNTFTDNRTFREYATNKYGPDWIEAQLHGPEFRQVFLHHVGDCTYTSRFRLFSEGSYQVVAHHHFSNFNALHEPRTGLVSYPYIDELVVEKQLECRGHGLSPAEQHQSECDLDDHPHEEEHGYYTRGAPDNADYTKYAGYWLKYKGEQPMAIPTKKRDLLGRMNFGHHYAYHHPDGRRVPRCDRKCLLELFRNRRVYLIGDSHTRIFFYGLLSRLDISYPLNKLWRGDRSDYIKEYNATVTYVASYFLNMSRPTAAEMLRDHSNPIVMAGIGQHHAGNCWSFNKHWSYVMENFPLLYDPAVRQLLWFGVPANPINKHLYLHQRRKECRNNQRHWLLNDHQSRFMRQHGIPFVDAYHMAVPLSYTNWDGAHYFTWVRDAQIDTFAEYLRNHGSRQA